MIPFADYCEKVKHHLETTYGIPVVTRDVPDALTGDLNGAEVHIDCAVSSEQRLFLLAHLFGHTVQWSVDPDAYEMGMPQNPPVREEAIPALMEYERAAAGYSLSMLHEIGITTVDQWLSDYTACDMAYLRHYYCTGERKEFLSFWRENTPHLLLRPIPKFTLTKRSMRSDGIVI